MVKEFFYFQKSDRKVMVFLLAVASLSLLLIYGLGDSDKSDTIAVADSLKSHSRSAADAPYRGRQYVYAVPSGRETILEPFDPNTADSTQLLRLGLSPWQVANIYKYRANGGIYRKPSDFARLYGLTAKQYRELLPYIRISDDYRPASELYADDRPAIERDTIAYPRKLQPGERIPLNSSDTSALKRVPGIGSYYAREIVRYRDRLGGYADVSQLKEIEGFPVSSLQYFEADDAIVVRLNLNNLTLNQMKRHPYINFFQARAITDYRRLKGPLRSLDDLRLLKDFTSADLQRLAPYVEF